MTEKLPARRRGTFVTFEGGEGVGKTTQAQLLQRRLERLGRRVVATREPGGTSLGEKLREIIFRPGLESETELLLILADRAQHLAEVIRPALERGEVVVCDRYSDSTVAYQGYGRGLDLAAIATANELASGGLRPDLSILLELPVDLGLGRKAGGTGWDSIGQESREFHERVHAGFRMLAAEEPERWMVVDASLPVERVSDLIWERVEALCVEESSGSDQAPA